MIWPCFLRSEISGKEMRSEKELCLMEYSSKLRTGNTLCAHIMFLETTANLELCVRTFILFPATGGEPASTSL